MQIEPEIQFTPSRANLREIKAKMIEYLSFHGLIDRAMAKKLRRAHVDDILDQFFNVASAVTMTLRDGRRVVVTAGYARTRH